MEFVKSYPFPFDINLIKKDCMGKSGVYLIFNNITGDFYIGSARSDSDKHNRIYIRFRNHFFNSFKSTNILLRNSLKKYGKHNFIFNILAFDTADKVIALENYYIEKFKPKYNFLQTALDSTGYKHTEETKLKMKNNYSEERRKLIGSLNLNKTFSSETKELLSKSMKNRHLKGEEVLITDSFLNSKSRPTSVFDLNGNLLKQYKSAKAILTDYLIDYRTIRRHIKTGTPINKLGIVIKYSL